jgi:putative ABC transport system permease protein
MTHHLFPGRPAVGSFIQLNDLRFEVVGTLNRVGRGDENSTNTRCYIPFQVMRSDFPLKGEESHDAISFINMTPTTADDHLLALDEARRVIARNHHFDYHDVDAFENWDTVQQAQRMGTIFDAMNEFLGTVGLVTLALGAIGVVNIMLIAVTERTREIGLRKALGATNRSIMVQFFAEGVLLTVVSGLIGMGLAGGFMTLLGNYNGPGGFDPPRLVPKTAMLAIASLTIAGVAAGIYPARKAARLEPVEALRKE